MVMYLIFYLQILLVAAGMVLVLVMCSQYFVQDYFEVTKGKQEGGLGMKNLELQNKAFITKLCWGLITKPDALWVKVLRSTY